MAFRLKFLGKSYCGKLTRGRILSSGDEIEVEHSDAVRLLAHTERGLWVPADDSAEELARELNLLDGSGGDSATELEPGEGGEEEEQERPRCSFIKSDGKRCQLYADPNSERGYCKLHERIAREKKEEEAESPPDEEDSLEVF